MARRPRVDIEGYFYHTLNRANAKQKIFKTSKDFGFFESILEEALQKFMVRLVAYCIMPNHFHFVLYSDKNNEVQKFMQWLTITHTQRLHARNDTVGHGHIYQGRYKSFVVETDTYLETLIRYVEQNPLRANLVHDLNNWKWSSFYRRNYGTAQQKKLLDISLLNLSISYHTTVVKPFSKDIIGTIRESVQREKPFGHMRWVERVVKKHGLESCMRKKGRPKKGT